MNSLPQLLKQLKAGRLTVSQAWYELPQDVREACPIWNIENLAKRAVCFDLGEARSLFDMSMPDIPIRFPFPVVWVEFIADVKEQDGSFTQVGIAVLAEELNDGHAWKGYVFRRIESSDRIMLLYWSSFFEEDNGRERVIRHIPEPMGIEEEEHHWDYPWGVMARAWVSLACNNVLMVENTPSLLKQRLAKQRKQPIFSTWTLHIKPTRSVGDPQGGTHASPRVHLRRGHMRQYAPGKYTWVQPCVVGKKELGVVHKDYAIDHVTQTLQ